MAHAPLPSSPVPGATIAPPLGAAAATAMPGAVPMAVTMPMTTAIADPWSGAPVYVTTGGGGDWIYESTGRQPEWSAFRETEFQHVQLTVDGGDLRVDSIRPDGSSLDSFTLQKEVVPVQAPAPAGETQQPPATAGSAAPGAQTAPGHVEPSCDSADCGGVLESFRKLLSTLGMDYLLAR